MIDFDDDMTRAVPAVPALAAVTVKATGFNGSVLYEQQCENAYQISNAILNAYIEAEVDAIYKFWFLTGMSAVSIKG